MVTIRSIGAVVAVLVMVPLTTAAACQPLAKACDVTFGGLEIRQGQVVETLTAVCDVPPQTHLLRAGIEQRVGDAWIELGRGRVVDVVPDPAGFPVEVSAPCEEGVWRSWVRVEGVGPLPESVPFTFSATGAERVVALVECAG